MNITSVPLRYPGGKASLLNYVEKFITSNKISVPAILEPYAGSAAISMGLLRKGMISKAYINDSDQMVYAFWKTIMNKNEELIEMIDSLEVNLDAKIHNLIHSYIFYRQSFIFLF